MHAIGFVLELNSPRVDAPIRCHVAVAVNVLIMLVASRLSFVLAGVYPISQSLGTPSCFGRAVLFVIHSLPVYLRAGQLVARKGIGWFDSVHERVRRLTPIG